MNQNSHGIWYNNWGLATGIGFAAGDGARGGVQHQNISLTKADQIAGDVGDGGLALAGLACLGPDGLPQVSGEDFLHGTNGVKRLGKSFSQGENRFGWHKP